MRFKKIYFVIAILIFSALLLNISVVFGEKSAASPSAANAGTVQVTLDATQDTFITGANGNYNTNFGTASSLSIGTSGTPPFIFGYNTLVDFDLSSLPSDAVIVSANLRLGLFFNRTNSPTVTNSVIEVFSEAITGNWGETTVTWANQPASASQGDPTNFVDGLSTWEDWDVTNIVSAWVSGGVTQNGIKLYSTSGSDIANFPFYSREAGIPPRLTITYQTGIPTETPTPTVTSTPTPTLPVSGSCPGTIRVYSTLDTYTDSSNPTSVKGGLYDLSLSKSPDTRYMFLKFPVEQAIPANQHIYSAAIYLHDRGTQVGNTPAPWSVFVFTPLSAFDEVSTSWNNQPGPFLGAMKKLTIAPGYGIKVIKGLEFFANVWHTGMYPNQGLGISIEDDSLWLNYSSREASVEQYRPYMEITCGSNPPTATPTPTSTPLPTATPTAVPKTANFIADGLEVTQGVQRITNSVRLVAGKRTFVRFFVYVTDSAHFDGKSYATDAELELYRGYQRVATLKPVNAPTGQLNLPYGYQNPYLDQDHLKMVVDNAFLFEIPSEFTNGSLRLVGNVNLDWKYPETNMFDNDLEATVQFETVPQFGLHIYRVKWQDDDNTYYTTTLDNLKDSLNFARQGLPVPDVWASSSIYPYDQIFGKGVPSMEAINNFLRTRWLWDSQNNGSLFQQFPIVRYYALMDKNRNKAGGLADGIPAHVASGWTNRNATMSHELGHTFGRHHSPFCGAKTGCVNIDIFGYKPCPSGFEVFPYGEGKIGPHEFSVEGFTYGANNTFEVRSSAWFDLMSYCDPRWISDFTYQRIMDYLQNHATLKSLSKSSGSLAAGSDNLLISGLVDLTTGVMDMSPAFVVPNSTPLGAYDAGDFAIVLRDVNGAELARYRFTPSLPVVESSCSTEQAVSDPEKLVISELVPYNLLTARVEVEGPNGAGVIGSLVSQPAVPTVSVTGPNGGEVLSGDSLTVTWSASDADDNNLFFNVQYSPDNGATWDMLAMNLTGSQAVIDRDNFHGSNQALIRVFASDGIHSAYDSSDATFTIVNAAPTVAITEPVSDTFVLAGQTVAFSAFAYDQDLGIIGGDYLTWSSDLDGVLGHGSQFSTAGLSVGLHNITVFVNDGSGGVAADSVQVRVYADASQVPALPDKLKVGPADIVIDTYSGPRTAFVQIYNPNNNDPVPWSASSSAGWLELSATSGTTEDYLFLNANTQNLPEGHYTATLTVTNQNNPAETYDVTVYMVWQYHRQYLPQVLGPR